MSSREGIEIDYCPKCRGVWLDRGELDKIIERTAEAAPPASPASIPAQAQPYQPPPGVRPASDDYRRHADEDYYRKHGKYGKYGKRKGLLGELFDFD